MLLGMCRMECVMEYHEPHVSKTTMRPSHDSSATSGTVVECVGVTVRFMSVCILKDEIKNMTEFLYVALVIVPSKVKI